MKGRKVIIVGFTCESNWYRVLDPEFRRYSAIVIVCFYESFEHRVGALRHFHKTIKQENKKIDESWEEKAYSDGRFG